MTDPRDASASKTGPRQIGPLANLVANLAHPFLGPTLPFFGKLSPRKLDPWKMLVWQIRPLYCKYKGAHFAGAQIAAPTFSRGLICRGPICWDPICLKTNWQTTPTSPTLPIKTKNSTKNLYHIHQLYIYMYQTQQVNQIYRVVWKILKSRSRAKLDDSRASYSHLT